MSSSWKLWFEEFRELDRRLHVNGEDLEAESLHRYSFLRNVLEAGMGTKGTLQEDNQRKEPRIPICIPVEVEWPGGRWDAFTLNVSWGGILIDDPAPIEAGESVQLKMVIEREGMEFITKGEAIWESRQGMGIAFKDSPGDQLSALAKILHVFMQERLIKKLGREVFEGTSVAVVHS